MPAAEVASRASVHESTVVRLAQKLGFSGYPQMRESLRDDALAAVGVNSRLVKAANSPRHELRSLVQNDADALLQLPTYVSQEDLTAAATLILSAGRVYTTGYPYTFAARAYLDRRLRRYGITVLELPDAAYDTAEVLQSMGPGDLLIAFALRRPPARLSKLLSIAKQREANSLIISDVIGMQFVPEPTMKLVAPRGSDDIFKAPIVPMMLVYALQLAILQVDPTRRTAALDQLDEVVALLDADGPANLYTDYASEELMPANSTDESTLSVGL